jgi:hypothetical protein
MSDDFGMQTPKTRVLFTLPKAKKKNTLIR